MSFKCELEVHKVGGVVPHDVEPLPISAEDYCSWLGHRCTLLDQNGWKGIKCVRVTFTQTIKRKDIVPVQNKWAAEKIDF